MSEMSQRHVIKHLECLIETIRDNIVERHMHSDTRRMEELLKRLEEALEDFETKDYGSE